jgi:hypothetical protein
VLQAAEDLLRAGLRHGAVDALHALAAAQAGLRVAAGQARVSGQRRIDQA